MGGEELARGGAVVAGDGRGGAIATVEGRGGAGITGDGRGGVAAAARQQSPTSQEKFGFFFKKRK